MIQNSANRSLRIWHLACATLLFCALFFISYPHYHYFVDPDAVAYLTMAKRAAEGDTLRLVNALWSPLHPAMVAASINLGVDALLAAQLTNALACILVLVSSFSLFRRAKVSALTGIPLLLSLSVFLVYALYKQLFCDLWALGFLIAYLRLINAKDFLQKPPYWLLCGLLAVLATYSKVYSFYFLLLHLPWSFYLLNKHEGRIFPWKPYITILAFQIVLLAPWTFLMHQKYGKWNLSMSGALNTSWTLVGHKTLADTIHVLIPPPYPNSPYTWEDPFLAEGKLHGRFESLAMIKSQIGHSILASTQFVEAMSQLSAFLFAALLIGAFIIWKKGGSSFEKILLLAAGIMPLGYLLLHVEARYIWMLLPIGMIIGALLLERSQFILGRKGLLIASWIFALSFVIWPVYDMKTLFHVGADVREEALILKKNGIQGTFSSNDNPSRSGLLAYWMNENFYTPVSTSVYPDALHHDLHKYKVEYFLEYIDGPRFSYPVKPFLLPDFEEIQLQEMPNVRIFRLESQ